MRMSRTPETTSPTERLGKLGKDSVRVQQPDILKEEWFPVFKHGNETQEQIGLILPLPVCTGFTEISLVSYACVKFFYKKYLQCFLSALRGSNKGYY